MHGRWAGDGVRGSRGTSGPERQDGLEGTPRGLGVAAPAGGPRQERSAMREDGAGVMGGAHSTANSAPHPAAHRPGDGAGPLRPPQPFRAGTRPLSLQSRVGGRGRPRRAGCAARPEPQPGMLYRGWRTGGRPCSLGREWGWPRAEEEPSAQPPQPGLSPRRPAAGRECGPRSPLACPPLPPSLGVAPGNSASRRRRETHLPRT